MNGFDLALAFMLVYVGIMVLACTGWLMGHPPSKKSTARLTVIIPFRNEAAHLPVLLHSLAAQTQVPHIVLVDDGSTDASRQTIETFRQAHPSVHITVLDAAGTGKKKASLTGLRHVATGPVWFTDADCTWQPHMVAQVTGMLAAGDPGFAYGPVLYGNNGKRTNAVFFLDQLALNAVALGLGKTGIHVYCSGACMGGRAQQMLQAAPQLQGSVNLSGDDVTYLQSARAHGQKIFSVTHPAFAVTTQQPQTMGAFLQQRLRWGQKAPGYKSAAPLLLSVLVFGVCALNVFVLISCLSGVLPAVWCLLPIIKLCIDLLFLFLVALRLGTSRYLWAFLPAWLLNLLYIPAVGVLGWFTNTTWKGRKVKAN